MIEPVNPEALPPSRPGAKAGRQVAKVAADDFTVHLDRVFHGPLDLLLQLVKEKEVEIHLVSLARVCDDYCKHVRALPKVDVDLAADYLVVAATLIAIKSRALVPREEVEMDEDPFDPNEELVQQLLAYKSLREAADALGVLRDARADHLPAGGRWMGRYEKEEGEEDQEWDLGEVSIWDLLKVVAKLEEETGFLRPHRFRPTGRPLRAYVTELWAKLQEEKSSSLHKLLQDNRGLVRRDAVYYLVALLELAKQQQVDLMQEKPFEDIEVVWREGAGDFHIEEVDEEFDSGPEGGEREVGELLNPGPGGELAGPAEGS